MVAVHAVVPSAHRRELCTVTDRGERGAQKAHRRLRRGIAAVEHRVEHHPLHPPLLRQRHHRHQVRVVRMHATVAQQSEQVERAAGCVDALAGLHQGVVLEKTAVLDGAADPHEILLHNPSGAQIQMSNLTVAHLSVGQSNGVSRRGQQRA